MPEAPLLIEHGGSETPLRAVDFALEEGCNGVRVAMRLKPIGRSQSNPSNSGYPRLKDVFEFCGNRMFLNIDLPRKGMVPVGLVCKRSVEWFPGGTCPPTTKPST